MDFSNPFRKWPRFLARQPRLIRLFIAGALVGFTISAIFTEVIILSNFANVGHLISNVDGGWLAGAVFFLLNGLFFSGVQISWVVMSMPYDDEPRRGTPVRPDDLRELLAVPVVSRPDRGR
ncbi:MAG: hypothetical protein AAGA15_11115 [Pseudomonadota bacterium]